MNKRRTGVAGSVTLVVMLTLFLGVAILGVLRPVGLSLAWFTGNADWALLRLI
jgi:hypothetical protein